MNWMIYPLVATFLLGTELLYIRLAIRFRIIDKPNERSSHSRPTVRGGGVIFWLAALLTFVYQDFEHPIFFAALTLVSLVSFLDDVYSLPKRYRFLVQLVSVGLLWQEMHLEQTLGWWWMPLLVIVGCGMLNAYNFMDGVNGITALYSLLTVSTLFYSSLAIEPFAEATLPVFASISLLVFTFFNARRKALCFAGDVGSISIGFIILFLLAGIMLKTGTLTYGLFLAVYGTDSVLTILHRFWLGENIFRPHKLHLFQLLVHRRKWSHVGVSGLYAFVQLLVNGAVLWLVRQETTMQWIGSLFIGMVLVTAYGFTKNRLLKQKPQTEPVAAAAI